MKAFIFDLDGTLLNTLGDIANSCNYVLRKNGYPEHPAQAYRHMVGNGFAMLLKRAVPPAAGLTDGQLGTLTDEAREYYAAHMKVETGPYPGMIGALEALAHGGAFLAVLSNKPDDLSGELIKYYFPSIPFSHIQGARKGLPLKPDPATLLSLLNAFAIDKEEACYTGDSNVDIFTARNAGICGVGAAWGFRGKRELAEAGADIIIEDPAMLPSLRE